MQHIAKKVGERQDGSPIYHAGPDAKGYEEGQIVPNDYAERARSARQHANAVKANMQKQNLTESEARERVNRLNKELQEEQQKEQPDQERIEEIKASLGGS